MHSTQKSKRNSETHNSGDILTGIYVSWENSKKLLFVFQDMLLNKYHTLIKRGPCLADKTYQIILRPLGPTCFNLNEILDLLEKYISLSVINTPLKLLREKRPEVIDLVSSDDKSSCILDNTGDDPKNKLNKCSSSNIDPFSGVMMPQPVSHKKLDGVVGFNNFKKSNIFSYSPSSTEHVTKIIQKQGCKRKEDFEKNELQKAAIETKNDDKIVLHEYLFKTKFGKCLHNNHKTIPIIKFHNGGMSLYVDKQLQSITNSVNNIKSNSKKLTLKSDNDDNSSLLLPNYNCEHNSSLFPPLKKLKSSNDQYLESTSRIESDSNLQNTSSVKLTPCSSGEKTLKLKKIKQLPVLKRRKLKRLTSFNCYLNFGNPISNIYNPNANSKEQRIGLRPIVIDGNNIAVGHGKGKFSLTGILICIEYFEKRGHRQIKTFLPNYRKTRKTHDTLRHLEQNGTVVFTPSRRLNNKVVSSNDDRYIVQYAAEFGGVIVSTDNYHNILKENPKWKETIENHLLMFTWVDDILMFPQDPLGRNGPSLNNFLKFPGTQQ